MTGLSFEVITSHVDEDAVEASVLQRFSDEEIRADMYRIAEEVAMAQARAKAEAVLANVSEADDLPGSAETAGAVDVIVIGSDTVVVTEDEILGKPEDVADARRMLTKLSGKTHRVYTGVAILKRCAGSDSSSAGNGSVNELQSRCFSAFANVKFHELDALQEKEIERYIAGGSPMDKAGAYGIQDEGALLIDSIAGDYYAVVGLPISQVNRELQKLL